MKNPHLIMFRTICICTVVVMAAGCASTKGRPTASGFLDDYSKMRPSTVVEGLYVDKSSGHDLGEYDKFMIDPVMAYFHRDAKGVGVDIEKLAEFTSTFREEAIVALSKHYEVVDKPGPGVLRIRTALTDVVPNKVALNLHWSTTLSKIGIGGATMEAEFLDSMSGRRIMAVIDSRKGKPLRYTKGLTKWGHTEDVLKEWVNLLVGRLDELHGYAPEEK